MMSPEVLEIDSPSGHSPHSPWELPSVEPLFSRENRSIQMGIVPRPDAPNRASSKPTILARLCEAPLSPGIVQ
eukprot:5433163-Pyramimonas_sp.AAC.1